MLANTPSSNFPNLTKLSIAILNHFIEPLIGAKAIEELEVPIKESELLNSLVKALKNTEERFTNEHTDFDIRVAVLGLPLHNLPTVVDGMRVFFTRPTDRTFARVLSEQMTKDFPNFASERIQAGVDVYLRILREELVTLSGDFYKKAVSLATLHIEDNTARMANALDQIDAYLRSRETKVISEKPVPEDLQWPNPDPQIDKKILAVCQVALTELLALQFPWGEWSDRRTTLESIIAEREPYRGPEGPKPNVARTLFALEALDWFKAPTIENRKNSALNWMLEGVSEGWYREWSSTQSLDSESSLPELVRRKDVRHTAQLVTALCRWGKRRDPLATLLKNIVDSCITTSGLWADTPGNLTPRFLATVYAVEALGHVIAGKFRLPLEDLLDGSSVNAVRLALGRGLYALHQEADQGKGLLGYSYSKPTAAMTGIALIRFAPLGKLNQEFEELVEKLLHGVQTSMEHDGWFDHAVPVLARPYTRKRATLRVAAGLGLAYDAGFHFSNEVWDMAINSVQAFILDGDLSDLDSPDFAYALLCCRAFLRNAKLDINLELVEKDAEIRTLKYNEGWLKSFQEYVSRLSTGRALGIPSYIELAELLEEHLRQLSV